MIFTLAAGLALSSCYKDDEGTPADVEPKYVIEDSSDPLDHARYAIFQNTGIYVLYQYDSLDYGWDVSSISKNRLVKTTDRTVLADGMEYMNLVLMDYYTDEFKRHYFPFRILLAQEVNNERENTLLTDRFAASGRSYLAIGRLAEGKTPATADDMNLAKGVIHGELWGNIIYANGLVMIPAGFFSPSEEYYEQDLSGESNKDDPATLLAMGFWSYDEHNVLSAYCTPDYKADVNDFVEMVTSHTAAEMSALMGSYAILKQKYNILVTAVREATGVDLQEIGNRKPAAR